jgi:hypothetical protein
MFQHHIPRLRTNIALAAAAGLLAGQACGNEDAPGAGGGADVPTDGEPSSGTGGGANAAGGSQAGPALAGSEGQGGSPPLAGTGATGGAGGGADPSLMYEQDDPNLQPSESSFELVEIPAP